jgi:hypothetical protein
MRSPIHLHDSLTVAPATDPLASVRVPLRIDLRGPA